MALRQNRSLITLYLAYFADYFSWGAAIAFLEVYITSDNTPFHDLFWNPQISIAIAYAAFPIGEVIGSPILGDLSDWIGRKKVLIWGFWGSILCMGLCALSLFIGSFILFVCSQSLIGFFSGKQSMAQAAIVETQRGTKGQKLAFLSVLGGVSWILGPFLGGLLISKPFLAYGGYIWPNILSCAVYVLSLLTIHLYFSETYEPIQREISPTKFLKSVGETFLLSWKEKLFFLFVINLLGWYLLAVSLSNFVIDRFHITNAQMGFVNTYFSLCFTIGGIIGTAWILRFCKAKNVLFWSLLVGSMGIFLLFGADKITELWTYLAIPTITEAWIYPAYQTVLSDHTSEKNQGKIFGLIGATTGICQFLAYLFLSQITSNMSILIAALLFLASGALMPAMIRKRKAANSV